MVLPVFVFDRAILEPLARFDRRVAFIHQSLEAMQATLASLGGGLCVVHGRAEEELPRLAAAFQATRMVAARDHEPSAIARDVAVEEALRAMGVSTDWVKDQSIF